MSKQFGIIAALAVFVVTGFIPPAQAAATPYLTLNSYTGRPGTAIRVTGGNFTPGETVSLSFNNQASASGPAAANGNFGPVNLMVPINAPQGPLTIEAQGSTNNTRVSNSFYVQPFTPAIQVKAQSNTPGSVVIVTGSGFAPGETVAATLDPSGNIGKADAQGNFTTSFTLPFKSPDTYVIYAAGENSRAVGSAYFYLGGFFPTAIPSNYFLTPGQTLTFTGWGFAPNEKVGVSDSNSGLLGEIIADRTGAFKNQIPIVMPANSNGTENTYTLTGAVSQKPVSFDVSIGTLNPQIFPSAYFMPPGKDLFFSGFGFSPNEPVAVFEGLNPEAINRIQTDKNGSFKNAYGFFMPFDFTGSTRHVRLMGEQSRAAMAVDVSIGTYHPQLAPSAYFIKSGQNLKIDGWNFSPGETVNIQVGNQSFKQVANKTGNILISDFTVPFNIDSFSVTAVGESTKASTSTTLTVGKYNPVVTASNYYVLPGQSLTFSGEGFAPGETVTISEQDNTGQIIKTGTVKSDGKGKITTPGWTIPFGSAPSQTFSFTGENSRAQAPVQLSIGAFNPYINADRYSVFPGTTVKVKGAGLGSSESVSVRLNGVEVAQTSANTKGETPQVLVPVPANTSGSATITFSGIQSLAQASLSISIQPFNPSVSPSTYFTLPGASVTFSGTGFAPGEKVTVSLDGQAAASANANSQGKAATGPVKIPFSASNSVSFIVTGEVSQRPSAITISLGNYQPGLLLSTYYAPAGTSLRITGSGFAPGEKVELTFDNTGIGTATADGKGGFVFTTRAPAGSAGNTNLTAKGTSSNATVRTNFTRAEQANR